MSTYTDYNRSYYSISAPLAGIGISAATGALAAKMFTTLNPLHAAGFWITAILITHLFPVDNFFSSTISFAVSWGITSIFVPITLSQAIVVTVANIAIIGVLMLALDQRR